MTNHTIDIVDIKIAAKNNEIWFEAEEDVDGNILIFCRNHAGERVFVYEVKNDNG